MRTQDFLESTATRFRRPSTWGAILVFGLVWVMVRLLAGQPFGRLGMGEFLVPVLLLAGHLALSPIPWQWTDDERKMAPLWRGCLQALPWNIAWLSLLLLLMHGIFPKDPPQPVPVGPRAAQERRPTSSVQPPDGSRDVAKASSESYKFALSLQEQSQSNDQAQPPQGRELRPPPRRPGGPPPMDRRWRDQGDRRQDRQPPPDQSQNHPREERSQEIPGPREEPLRSQDEAPNAPPRLEEAQPTLNQPRQDETKPPARRPLAARPAVPAEAEGLSGLIPSPQPEFMLFLLNLPFAMVLGWFLAEKERAEATEEELLKLARQAQAKALQAQLHPHALYNVLGGLTELVHEDPDAAEEALIGLVEMLRMLTRQGSAAELPLSQERVLIKHYLGIEEIRLGSRLQVSWHWPEWADSLLLPPLLLQPLVENAIKHGIAPNPEGGALRIGVYRSSRDLVFRVANTGRGLEPGTPEGTGMRNLRERLALYPQLDASLELRWEEGWTLAELRVRDTLGA